MVKNSLKAIIFLFLCSFLITVSGVKAEDTESIASQLSSELKESGVLTQDEAKAIEPSLSEMVKKGAKKEDLKKVVTELSDKGVEGDDLENSVNSMKDRVNAGENPKEVGNLVSQAAAQAHKEGLKGKDLAAKVQEAVKQRKSLKDAEKDRTKAVKEKTNKIKDKSGKINKESESKVNKTKKSFQSKIKTKGK